MNASVGGEIIRVRGLVQGVGFRPTVWRLARDLGLGGDVRNDGEGVLIRLWGRAGEIEAFCQRLLAECPLLARIDSLERAPWDQTPGDDSSVGSAFQILASDGGRIDTGVVADAATCPACAAEIADPTDRRFRYPFGNCTHCGPRLSIVRAIPYDRANTSMAAFPLCPDCRREYEDPADRRFHAQPIACPVCGPRAWLEDPQGQSIAPASLDAVDVVAAASRLLGQGRILAIKGIGGFHLACDATNPQAVATLRQRKGRYRKPFALMARDLMVIRGYARVTEVEEGLLLSPAAPVVLLEARHADAGRGQGEAIGDREEEGIGDGKEEGIGDAKWVREAEPTAPPFRQEVGVDSIPFPPLAGEVAPGQITLGFMLPYSPLHRLLFQDWDRPLVMTSGNRSEEPQCITNEEARQRLGGLADALLLNDRDILNRVDDSVLRVMAGEPRPLRRARGLAPTPIKLPPGFEAAPPILALGGELKNTICLLRPGSGALRGPLSGADSHHGAIFRAPAGPGDSSAWVECAEAGPLTGQAQAILSQHLGDLEEARTADEFERTIALYQRLFQHRPAAIALDRHPDYRSTLVGQALASTQGIEVIAVQHHFAHIASVLADAAWPLDGGPVLGLAFDGLGWGEDGRVWGGEFLLADYRRYQRLGHLRPVPLPGGARANREPWRNLYAQLATCLGWEAVAAAYPDLELTRYLRAKPLSTLDTMMARGLNSPWSSSCGRLFDAVAAALGVCPEALAYEGQAAIELESLAVRAGCGTDAGAYPFGGYVPPFPGRLDARPEIRPQGAAVPDRSMHPSPLAGEGPGERGTVSPGTPPWYLDPMPMWQALLADLAKGEPRGLIAARFHNGLARGTADLAGRLAKAHGLEAVALSGGVFQNRTLFEALVGQFGRLGLRVLSHRQVPANDGGLALGQAVVAAAKFIEDGNPRQIGHT